MSDDQRQAVEQRERARGALRALYLGELAAIGRRRSEALREADAQLGRLATILSNVVSAGIGVAEIARATEVSRPTVYKLLPVSQDKPRDIRLAVLQATLDGSTVKQIAKVVRWPAQEVEALLMTFEQRGWVRRDGPTWWLDQAGVAAIDGWDIDESIDEFIRERRP